MYNLGDETLAERWVKTPYMQYFCGYVHFQHKFPCDPSDFVHFRKRIGEEGMKKIFEYTVSLNKVESGTEVEVVLSDTTVQENNTTFPTDAKLYRKVIEKVHKIAKAGGIKQEQSFIRVSKEQVRKASNRRGKKQEREAKKATKQLKREAEKVTKELEDKLGEERREKYKEIIEVIKEGIESTEG